MHVINIVPGTMLTCARGLFTVIALRIDSYSCVNQRLHRSLVDPFVNVYLDDDRHDRCTLIVFNDRYGIENWGPFGHHQSFANVEIVTPR